MYVVLEGIDTCGKSTQINALKEYFTQAVFTKEPGGSALGAKIRTMILQSHTLDSAERTNNEALSKEAEFFLFLADRAEHFAKVIKPNLNRLIISDRSLISGIAYAQHIPQAEFINRLCMQDIVPDICFVFEITKPTLLERLSSKIRDSIEARGIDYLLTIQERILYYAKSIAKQTITLNASAPQDEITKIIVTHLTQANIKTHRF